MQNSTFRTIGIVFAALGLVLVITRSGAGIAFLVMGVTFLLIWWDQDRKGKRRRG